MHSLSMSGTTGTCHSNCLSVFGRLRTGVYVHTIPLMLCVSELEVRHPRIDVEDDSSRAEPKMTGRTSHRLVVALVAFLFVFDFPFDSFRPGLVKAQISMTTLYRSPRQK